MRGLLAFLLGGTAVVAASTLAKRRGAVKMADGGGIDGEYYHETIEKTARQVKKGFISIGEGERKLSKMEASLKGIIKEQNKGKSERELEIIFHQVCSKYDLDFDIISEEYAKGGAISDLAGALKENFKDSKALGKKYSSKKKSKDLMKFKGKAWKEYGKDIVGMQVKDAKRKAKVIADNPEILAGKFFSNGGYINSSNVAKLVNFLQFNRITAAAKTSEQLSKEFGISKTHVEAIRRAVKSNYTLKEVYEMLRKMNN